MQLELSHRRRLPVDPHAQPACQRMVVREWSHRRKRRRRPQEHPFDPAHLSDRYKGLLWLWGAELSQGWRR
jgi:hypothetical protein